MESLPSELFSMVLNYLRVNNLGTCTLVQKRWNAMAKQVLLDQAKKLQKKLQPDVLCELGSLAKQPDPNEAEQMMLSLDLILTTDQIKSLFILQLYENTFFDPSKPIKINVEAISTGSSEEPKASTSKSTDASAAQSLSPIKESFFKSLNKKGSRVPGFLPVALPPERLIFMSCYNILVVPCLEKRKPKRFFVMAKQPKWEPNVEYIDVEPDREWRWEEYGILFTNILHANWKKISAYGDTILLEKPRKRFDLFKIIEVNHSFKKITMKREEEFTVEVVVKDFINFNGRVFMMVENDLTYLVVRDNAAKRQKRIEILEHPLLIPNFQRKFFRMNNLIFIALTPKYPIHSFYKNEVRNWLIFDGNAADPIVSSVNMTRLLRNLIALSGCGCWVCAQDRINSGRSGGWGTCRFVESVSCLNNLFIAVYSYYSPEDFENDSHLEEANQRRRILVATMKRAPKVEDFLSEDAFAALFPSGCHTKEFVGEASPPFYYPRFSKGVNVLGGRGGVNSLYEMSTST